MSTEMFPFLRHVIIAQGNKLFHTWEDAVHADMLFAVLVPGHINPRNLLITSLILHFGTSCNVIFPAAISFFRKGQMLEKE